MSTWRSKFKVLGTGCALNRSAAGVWWGSLPVPGNALRQKARNTHRSACGRRSHPDSRETPLVPLLFECWSQGAKCGPEMRRFGGVMLLEVRHPAADLSVLPLIR